MTGQVCRTGSIRPPPVLAPRSSRPWLPTCAGGSPGRTRSRAAPRCASSRGFGRSSPPKTRFSSAGASGPGIAALEGPPFVLRQTAPDTGVLTGLDGPFQAGLSDLAATAYGLGLFDLEKGGTGVPNREEQLRVFVQAGSAVAPVHRDRAP